MQSWGENSNTATDRNINSGEVNLHKCQQEPGSWEKTSPSWEADYQNIISSTAAFLYLPPLTAPFPFFLVARGTQAAVPSLWFENSLLPSMPVNSTTHFLLTKHPSSLNCVLWIYINLCLPGSVKLHYVYTLLYWIQGACDHWYQLVFLQTTKRLQVLMATARFLIRKRKKKE